MSGVKDKVARLEAEVAELKEQLALHERAERLEQELAELKRRLPKVPTYSPMWNGYVCAVCGQRVSYSSYHYCPGRVFVSSDTGYTSAPNITVQAYNASGSATLALVQKDDPPDDGVLARVS